MSQASTVQNTQGQSSAMVTFTINNQTICMEANEYASFMDDVHFSDPTATLEENLAKYMVVSKKSDKPTIN